MGFLGMIGGPTKLSEVKPSFAAFMADYGMAFRTAKHGAKQVTLTDYFSLF
jgi:hypothetical protein